MRNKVSLFNKSKNINIKDSSLTVNVGSVQHIAAENKLDLFFDAVSLNAILNAGGRADEVRCYPGTREELIGKVEKWMDGQSKPDRRMLWLSGPAGAGKSAIAQTVAERGRDRGVHAANFFFFRGDHSRNQVHPLVATLVYQLIDFYPALREHLTNILTAKPLAHKASVEEQFASLVAPAIENVRRSSSVDRPVILIVDGLDECNDDNVQVQILSALHALVSKEGSPFRVMVASRAEPRLVMFFNRIGDSAQSIFLNYGYRPEDDIRKFVTGKFDNIKRVHYLAHTLNDNWPAQRDINEIVSKSSGQFIYVATVMRFIEHSKDSPALSLLTVLHMRPPTDHSPFAELDAVYSHIFSKARNLQAIKWVLAMDSVDISGFCSKSDMMRVAGYEEIELQSFFADISAIAEIHISDYGLRISFYHASLPDYLRDKSRSGLYYVGVPEIVTELTAALFQKVNSNSPEILKYIIDSKIISRIEEPTNSNELAEAMLHAFVQRLNQGFESPLFWRFLVNDIGRLYFTTDKASFKRVLRSWVRFSYIHKFDISGPVDLNENKSAARYYTFYKVTERAKVALKSSLGLV